MLYPISANNPDTNEELIGYIDHSGHAAVKPNYRAGAYFSDGLAAVCKHDGSSGFIDVDGEIRIPFTFSGLDLFHEGLCAIGRGTNVGYVDRAGNWAINPIFAIGGRFSEGLALASLNGVSFGYIDRSGAFTVKPKYRSLGVFNNGIGSARLEDKWGYICRKGSVIVPFQFDGPRAQAFISGLAGVCVDQRWGYIDIFGNWAVMPQYENVKRFYEGVAPVRVDGKWGLISTDGRILVAPRFDDLDEFDGGMAAASLDGKAGFVSPEGEWVVEPRFDKCYRFVGALAVVETGDRSSYVSRGGAIIWTSDPYAMPLPPPFRD